MGSPSWVSVPETGEFGQSERAVLARDGAVRLSGRAEWGGSYGPAPGGVVRFNGGAGAPGLLLGDLLQPVNLVVLRSTVLLEAAVIAAVVIVDASYRRLRRARRARTRQSRAAPE